MQVLVNFPCRLLCARNRQPESTKSAPPGESLMVRECQRSCRSVAFGRMCGHTNRLKPTLWLPTNRIDKIRSVSRVDHRFVCELGCLNFRCLPASVTVFRMCVRPGAHLFLLNIAARRLADMRVEVASILPEQPFAIPWSKTVGNHPTQTLQWAKSILAIFAILNITR